MYRLLIVDDEHHIVDWLVELFYDQGELELELYKAYSGIHALKLIEERKMDIILLDIHMPGMDGLMTAERILSLWPDARIIFLTGFHSFDYIYHANKMKHISYLLKTEDDEGILEAVGKAVESIKKEKTEDQRIIALRMKEKIYEYFLNRQMLRRLITGRGLAEGYLPAKADMKEFPLDDNRNVCLMYGHIVSMPSSRLCLDDYDFMNKIILITEQMLLEKFHYVLYNYDRSTLLWVVQPTQEYLAGNLQPPLVFLKEMFDGLVTAYDAAIPYQTVLQLYDGELSLQKINEMADLMNAFTQKYQLQVNSSHTYGIRFTQKEKEALMSGKRERIKVRSLNSLLDALESNLYQGDQPAFFEILDKIRELYQETASMHHVEAILSYQRIANIYLTFICQYELDEEIATRIGIYPLYYMQNFNDWKEGFGYLYKMGKVIFDFDVGKQLKDRKKLTHAIQSYIAAHLSEDLTLTAISAAVNYNTSYISRIFKQETGISLSVYINQVRTERAKDLLLNTDYSIQSIAGRLGYDTSQYFSSVFKKSVGVSPTQYRGQKEV